MASVLADFWPTAWHKGIWASGGAFMRFQATACENNPRLLPPGPFSPLGQATNQPCQSYGFSSPAALFPSCVSLESSGAERGVSWERLALLCCWRSSSALSGSLRGPTHLFLSPLCLLTTVSRTGEWVFKEARNCCA